MALWLLHLHCHLKRTYLEVGALLARFARSAGEIAKEFGNCGTDGILPGLIKCGGNRTPGIIACEKLFHIINNWHNHCVNLRQTIPFVMLRILRGSCFFSAAQNCRAQGETCSAQCAPTILAAASNAC